MELLMEHLSKGFIAMLLVSMPVVLVAAGIGLIIGILQAVTQVQEQTIAAAPKILGVFLTIILLGNFFTKVLNEYLIDSINMAFKVITKQGDFVLPPAKFQQRASFFGDDKSYTKGAVVDIDSLMQQPASMPNKKK
jgi:flagellar biosynthesis protein FliQ